MYYHKVLFALKAGYISSKVSNNKKQCQEALISYENKQVGKKILNKENKKSST